MSNSVKVAINGFGRIGRMAFRRAYEESQVEVGPKLEVVAINDLSDPANLAYLLKYDSAHGIFNHEVSFYKDESHAAEGTLGGLIVDGKKIPVYAIAKSGAPLSKRVFANADQTKNVFFPWKELGVKVVLESTGFYLKKELAQDHIDAGAEYVIMSAPAKDDTPTFVYGVNTDKLIPDMHVVSGASCTTNCLSPMLSVIEKKWGVKAGFMTTVHAYTNDQTTLDLIKAKDFRRGRAAAENIVPTSTGAAKAVKLVIPSMAGRLDGIAIRVPVLDGSLCDLTLELKEHGATVEEINALEKAASEGELKGVLGYNTDPIVSRDILGRTEGSIFDATETKVIKTEDGAELVKVFAWYDNEFSYTCQFVRLAKKVASFVA